LYGYVLGDPVGGFDPSGLVTELYLWEGVGFGSSAFGHVSIGINNTSYSWNHSGMLVSPLKKYIGRQGFRNGIRVPLLLTPEQEKAFEEFLKNYNKDNDYWVPGNVCTEPINEGLENLGFSFNPQLIPMAQYLELIRAGLVGIPSLIRKKK
jgi:hypothetical protein